MYATTIPTTAISETTNKTEASETGPKSGPRPLLFRTGVFVGLIWT